MNEIAEQQAPFAASLAVNLLAKDIRDAANKSIDENFQVRKPWVSSHAFVVTPSDKHQSVISATVALRENHQLLAKFEEGGIKTAHDPINEPIAIPTTALRPAFGDSVPLDMYPKNLRLQPRKDIVGILPAKGRPMRNGLFAQLQGKRRTFVIDPATMPSASKWGVWQRFGPGKHDIVRIWTYAKRIPIPRRLGFKETAIKVATEKWAGHVTEAWNRAMSTAR